MTEYLLSIDAGKSSGIALLSYDETSAPVLEKAWQFGGGVVGLLACLESPRLPLRLAGTSFYRAGGDFRWPRGRTGVIAEKFTARATKGFSYRTDALEPLRCEGALIALGIMPDYDVKDKRWLDPGLQYLVGGKDRADKKKRQARFLKDSGYYRTGKDFGTADADDFRSACAHAIGYLARVKKHEPSYKLIADWVERNP